MKMEKQEILDTLNNFIAQIDTLKSESGPKSPDFIKWVRDVKQFIEKNYGADFNLLRDFKKIDYYPKKFDILSSESAFKKAWEEGIESARLILLDLKSEIEGVSIEVETEAEQIKSEENEDASVAGTPKEEAKAPEDKKGKKDEEPVEEKAESETDSSKKQEASEDKKDSKKSAKEKDSKDSKKDKKVLLVNINDEKLNTSIFKFIKTMGYEPAVIDQDIDGEVFISDSIEEAFNDDSAVYSIILWQGDITCEGKKIPSPRVFFSTGCLVANLSKERVLILHSGDVDVSDDNYAGLNFLEIDNISELMQLKVAREMDNAGLDIDFNFFKKK